jgi:carbonic anhydrase
LVALSKKYYYSWINFSDEGKLIGFARINVQNNLALLKANPLIVANPQIAIHGALYDVKTGAINFLSGSDLNLSPL